MWGGGTIYDQVNNQILEKFWILLFFKLKKKKKGKDMYTPLILIIYNMQQHLFLFEAWHIH